MSAKKSSESQKNQIPINAEILTQSMARASGDFGVAKKVFKKVIKKAIKKAVAKKYRKAKTKKAIKKLVNDVSEGLVKSSPHKKLFKHVIVHPSPGTWEPNFPLLTGKYLCDFIAEIK